MENIPFLPFVLFFVVGAFHLGRVSVSSPSEEEMIRRIKKIRLERKLREETSAAVEKELQV